MIKAVGANGGAVCVNFFSGFLDQAHYQAILQYLPQMKTMTVDQSQRFLRGKSLPPVSLARIADHIDHIVKVAGPTTPASAATSTAFPPFPPAWKTRRNCRGSPPSYGAAGTRRISSKRSSAATCCVCWRR